LIDSSNPSSALLANKTLTDNEWSKLMKVYEQAALTKLLEDLWDGEDLDELAKIKTLEALKKKLTESELLAVEEETLTTLHWDEHKESVLKAHTEKRKQSFRARAEEELRREGMRNLLNETLLSDLQETLKQKQEAYGSEFDDLEGSKSLGSGLRKEFEDRVALRKKLTEVRSSEHFREIFLKKKNPG
jgi:hypothetical protein